MTVSPDPAVVNGQNTVTNPISGMQQFYRPASILALSAALLVFLAAAAGARIVSANFRLSDEWLWGFVSGRRGQGSRRKWWHSNLNLWQAL